MYTRFQLAKKFLGYYLHASNSKGFGTHSPFVFNFITQVLDKKDSSDKAYIIEKYRERLLADNRKIHVDDFGTGSFATHNPKRKLSDIASASLKNKKYAALLYRIVKYYGSRDIVELGTSLGTTTSYLASASPKGNVITLEGAGRVADIAEDFFTTVQLENIRIIRGDFGKTVPLLVQELSNIDLLFVDGNHQEEPTIHYFESFQKIAHNNSIFIFDDIHWSKGMENAWEKIKQDENVTLTIDLFFIGIVFFRKEFMVKQHFTIRY